MRRRRRLAAFVALVSLHFWTITWVSAPLAPVHPEDASCSAMPGWQSPAAAPEQCLAASAPLPKAHSSCRRMTTIYLDAFAREVSACGGPVVLTHGSLLGWKRECTVFLSTDHDMDVGVYPREWNRLSLHRVQWRAVLLAIRRLQLLEAFQFFFTPAGSNSGFEYATVRGQRLPAKVYLKLGFESVCRFDIWVQHSNGTHNIEYNPGWHKTYASRMRPLQRVQGVPGLSPNTALYAPVPASDTLVERFGEGWRQPVEWGDFQNNVVQLLPLVSGLAQMSATVRTECYEVGSRKSFGLFWIERGGTLAFVVFLFIEWRRGRRREKSR